MRPTHPAVEEEVEHAAVSVRTLIQATLDLALTDLLIDDGLVMPA